jgi:hypothetical protein
MSEDKFDQAILKIFKLTHLGKIEWGKAAPPKSVAEGRDWVLPLYFQAEYQDRKLGLFRERVRQSLAVRSAWALAAIKEGDVPEWTEIDRLVLLDEDGEVAFSFPHSRIIKDLLETVRYKTSGVDQFLDELLNTEN